MTLVGWTMGGVVLLLLLLIAAMLKAPVRLLLTGERARGVIVRIDVTERSDEDGHSTSRSPVVEFVTPGGERVSVSGASQSASPSRREGDAVTVAYNASRPQDAQLLLLSELYPVGFLLGFLGAVVGLWISGILLSGDPALSGPFRFLPALAAHFGLHPVRFPLLFVLSLAIPASGLGTYVFTKRALDLRAHGVRAVGRVVEFRRETSELQDRSTATGVFPMIAYVDSTGTEHVIRGSLAKPLSRLRVGDAVEVVYLAHSPDRAVLNTWDELFLAPLIFGLFTIAFLAWLGLVLRGTIRV